MGMKPEEARQKFKLADQLYRDGRYGQALVLLDALEAWYPNTKNIMMPRALCLAELGRKEEALQVCDRLIEAFDDPRAKALRTRLAPLPAGMAQIGVIPDLGETFAAAPPPTRRESRFTYSWPWVAGGAAVALAVIVAAIFASLSRGGSPSAPRPPAVVDGGQAITAQEPQRPMTDEEKGLYILRAVLPRLGLLFVIDLVEAVVVLYLTLLICAKLPTGEFLDDLKSIALVAVGLALLSGVLALCPCTAIASIFILYFILKKVYDVGVTDYIVFILLNVAMYFFDTLVIMKLVFPEELRNDLIGLFQP